MANGDGKTRVDTKWFVTTILSILVTGSGWAYSLVVLPYRVTAVEKLAADTRAIVDARTTTVADVSKQEARISRLEEIMDKRTSSLAVMQTDLGYIRLQMDELIKSHRVTSSGG
jgi:hypothetical protein